MNLTLPSAFLSSGTVALWCLAAPGGAGGGDRSWLPANAPQPWAPRRQVHTLRCLREAGLGPGQLRCSGGSSWTGRQQRGEHHPGDSSQSLCPLVAQPSWALPSPRTLLGLCGAWQWQRGGDPASVGLLGAGPLLCLQGRSNQQENYSWRQAELRAMAGLGGCIP